MTQRIEEDPQELMERLKTALPALVENMNNDARLPWVNSLTLDELTVSRIPPTLFSTGEAFHESVRKLLVLDFRGRQVRAELIGSRLTIVRSSNEDTVFFASFSFHNHSEGTLGTVMVEFDSEGSINELNLSALYRDGQPLGGKRGEYNYSDAPYLQALVTGLMLKSADDMEPASGVHCTVVDGIRLYNYKEMFAEDAGYMDSQVQIPPRRLPQVRNDLIKEYRHIGPLSPVALSQANKDYFAEIAAALESSEEMWWVSEDMSKLAWDVAMSGTEPEDLNVRDLPAPSGIMWLNGGGGPVLMTKKQPDSEFLDTGNTETEHMSINAIVWYTPTTSHVRGVEVGVPRFMGLTASPGLVRDTAQWNGLLSPMDVESNEAKYYRIPAYVTYYKLRLLSRTLALVVMRLAREESLAEKTMETAVSKTDRVGRASKGGAKKKREKRVSTITCANLRKNRYESEAEREAEARQFSHRWIVRGHMRNQPYGPRNAEGGQKHERVWIAPYVKGPDDKPLVLKDRVQLFR